ncbi:hypothetical protein BGZ89_002039 [Linnemannia elongata]|nr:hypothetical protein BGZ89_002039 [Linnemannia elongata]
MEIPHSAILTPVVWVFDTKYQWWPGKIKPYPPQHNQAKVTRLGSVKPKTITVECVETSILPFEHVSKERFRQSGSMSSHARAFQEAYKEASAEQLKDDDGLPNMDDVFSHLSALPPTSRSPSLKDTLGEMANAEEDENYEDTELESEVVDLYPTLYAIVAGTHDEAGRLKAFLKGGTAKNQLAQRVGPGDFTQNQYMLISRILQSEFLPDLSTTKQIPRLMGHSPSAAGTATGGEGGFVPMKREGDVTFAYSGIKRVQFVTEVLLPETVTRLTMRRKGMSYADADKDVFKAVRSRNTDHYWVEDILAARESFLDGTSA